jgi:hypothetical protein
LTAIGPAAGTESFRASFPLDDVTVLTADFDNVAPVTTDDVDRPPDG